MAGIRVLIVDPHPIVREGMARICEAQSDIELVAATGWFKIIGTGANQSTDR
ncbi:MAG: hypothetical protein AAF639_35925 [Chloroflexota bacterium]